MRYALENDRSLTLTPNQGSASLRPVLGVGAAGEPGLPGPGAAAWTAAQAVTVGEVRQAPDGSWIKSTANRTTRASFDATEQTFWTTVLATSGTLEQVAVSAVVTTASTADRARANHTGTQSADTLTDGTTNKAYTATEKTKLAGVATGATANSTDATLLARANHTGTQAASTITGLGTAATVNTGTTSGTVPLLGASGTLAVARLATGTPDGTKFVRDDGTLATPAGGGGTTELLASTGYNPAAVTTVTNATSTYTDVDATNLILPTFTIPASGAVIIVLTARVMANTASAPALWGVGVAGTVVAASTARVSAGVTTVPARVSHRVKITGLTPGATSSAYRWMHANQSTSTTTTSYGGTGVNADGQALMEVWSA